MLANRISVAAVLVGAALLGVAACSGSQSTFDSGPNLDPDAWTETGQDLPSGDFLGQKIDVVLSMTSMECYSFDPQGSVELRHNGSREPSDLGTFYGDSTSGVVAWRSGRSSTVVMSGGQLSVDGLRLTPISDCT
jgi:hypothetical protein